jgi:hypothetical protein
MELAHRLIIPINPSQFESADWVAIMLVERKALQDLLEEMGLNTYDHYAWIKCLAKDGRHCHVLYFATKDQAVLFRLRYHGACQYVQLPSSGEEQPK